MCYCVKIIYDEVKILRKWQSILFFVTLFYFIYFFAPDKLIQIVMTLEFLKYNIKLISMAQEHNAFLMAALEVIDGV